METPDLVKKYIGNAEGYISFIMSFVILSLYTNLIELIALYFPKIQKISSLSFLQLDAFSLFFNI